MGTYSFKVTLNNFMGMEVHKTQRVVMELHFTCKQVTKGQSRNIIVSVASNIIASIPILHIQHDNKRFIVELICPKEF